MIRLSKFSQMYKKEKKQTKKETNKKERGNFPRSARQTNHWKRIAILKA